ncbi:MAG: ydaO [Phycisphaerales bacterium]|nr:ydaO [Phycisphaerales bacterium]
MTLESLLLGRPLASSEQEKTKLSVLTGVSAMGLDGFSSSAYGPEAALAVLIPLGVAGLAYIGPIMLVILTMLVMLYFSYRQTIAAYPVNGGSYTVARENLGIWAGLLAAAALMIDYILNVAVGISAGVAALVSAAPRLHPYMLPICLIVLVMITLLNLRGTIDAGRVFAIPMYLFIGSLLCVIGIGVARTIAHGGHPEPVVAPPPMPAATAAVGLWLLLRSFASGCTAMTGVEAVSNGVSAFKEPTVKKAHRTLTVIVGVLAVLLGGVAFLARAYHVGAMDQTRPGYQSILSQLTGAAVGHGWFYYVTIGSVLTCLCLSANTSFVDFPRLSRLIARDGFLPRAFATAGRRLVYSAGILLLAGAAGALLAVFDGITDRLIPLFAVGAFLAFTLSQAGMVMHWREQLRRAPPQDARATRGPGRGGSHVRMWVNGIGAVATGAALAIILMAKFTEGAWITILAIPLLLTLFHFVNRYYLKLDAQTSAHRPVDLRDKRPPVVIVLTRGYDRPTAKALRFAMWLSPDLIAIHCCNFEVKAAREDEQRVRREWAEQVERPAREAGVPPPELEVVQSPYRRLVYPILRQIDRIKDKHPGREVAVVVPEVIETHWWELLLHRHKAAKLRRTLIKRGDRHVVVIDVPWYLRE